MSKPDEFKFDSRVRERLLRNRALSAPDLKRHLDALPDLEGEYDVLNDTPQPAVTPARDHSDEPLVFDGIRRLQALSSEAHPRPSPVVAVSASAPLPPREPPGRPLGSLDSGRGPSPALRSALMESEISGVGAGAVSAALGAMAAEARSAAAANFPPPPPPPSPPPSHQVVPVPPPSVPEEPQTPLTLRSQAAPEGLGEDATAVADWEAPYPDSEDMK